MATKEKKTVILVKVDDSCEMASVSVNKKGYRGMEGNFWDFHPGCHGIEEYGDFKGYGNFVQMIYLKLIKDGVPSNQIEIHKEKYKYDE